MPWPSTLSSFSNPIPTDRLNNPSHSSVETAQNTGLTELQTYIGVTTGANASALGTILYDIKAPGSGGGGHIQTAVLGGTGQSSYTKGDILVAQSSSTISKLAVGTDGQILQANSAAGVGINWVNNNTPKVTTVASTIQIRTATETSLFSVSIPGSTLGMNNAIRSRTYLTRWATGAFESVIALAQYGGGTVGSVALVPTFLGTQVSIFGALQHTIVANEAVNSQKHFLTFDINVLPHADSGLLNPAYARFSSSANNASTMAIQVFDSRIVSSVNSSANQTFGMTIRTVGTVDMDFQGTVVEKIT